MAPCQLVLTQGLDATSPADRALLGDALVHAADLVNLALPWEQSVVRSPGGGCGGAMVRERERDIEHRVRDKETQTKRVRQTERVKR